MPLPDEPSLGTYGRYWEYRRTTHRRLVLASNFSQEEALKIGEGLEDVTTNCCEYPVNCGDRKIMVYIGKFGQVRHL